MTLTPITTPVPATGARAATGAASAPGTGDAFAALLAAPSLGPSLSTTCDGEPGREGSTAPAGTPSGTSGEAVDGAVDGAVDEVGTGTGVAEDAVAVLAAAQMMAAAQLVPVSPLLARAIRQGLTLEPGAQPSDGGSVTRGSDLPPSVLPASMTPATTAPASPDPAALNVVPAGPIVAGAPTGVLDSPGASQTPMNGMTQATTRESQLASPAATPATDPGTGPGTGPTFSKPTGDTADLTNLAARQLVADEPVSDPHGRPVEDAGSGDQPTGVDPTTGQTGHNGQHTGQQGQQGRPDQAPAPQPRIDGLSIDGLSSTPAAAQSAGLATPSTGPEQPQPLASYGVAGQVFGEVSRLVSRGDGTRRITLNLQPELLGDVRVVLTVRGGEVHVRMAGGDLAQQALLQDAPELHRLLDAVGATSSRIVVGDTSATFQQNSSANPQDGQRPADQYFGGTADRHTGQHSDHSHRDHSHRDARTRHGDTSARDGSAATGSVSTHLPPDPGTRTRTGVDVTM